MEKMVSWFIFLERNAMEFYDKAAAFFKSNSALSLLLEKLANDEEKHFSIMTKVSQIMKERNIFISSDIIIDDSDKAEMGRLFSEYNILIENRELSEKKMAEAVFAIEFYEWNNLFLYVVNTFKNWGKEFENAASFFEKHKILLKEFLQTCPGGNHYLERIGNFPEVWKNRMLVVEDYKPMCDLMKLLFKDQYDVETAQNGAEGLQKARDKHFDLIVSDINMPVMDGMSFYRKIAEQEPRIGKRFLFMSGNTDNEVMQFVSDNDLMFLKKPASIVRVRQAVEKLAAKSSQA